MTLEFLGLMFLLLLSAFFSSSEIAYIVSNRLKIELRSRKNNPSAKSAQYFVDNPQTFFSTLLISNNVVNIAFASLLALLLIEFYQLNDYIILIISTLLILFFGELIPKYIAREFADSLILLTAIPLRIISFILYPFVWFTNKISLLFTKFKNDSDNQFELVNRDDLHSLILEGSEVGKVDEEDSDVIKNIIDLSERKVYEAMTPRTDIVGVNIDTPIDEVINVFVDSGYSKLIVYEDNLDNIRGVVYVYDMFTNPKNLNEVIREIIYIPETKRCLEMLNEFLEKQISITVVVDEFGGTAGIITVEDIIEELFGEIRDEYDDDPDVCKKIDDKTYVFSGKVEVDYLNEEFELGIPDGDYETISGYITTKIGKIPAKGEKLDIDDFKIIILHSSKTKIDLVKLFKNK